MIGKQRFLVGLSVVAGCVAIAIVAWKISALGRHGASMPASPAAPGGTVAKVEPDALDPVLAVFAGGGTALELGDAIGVLDTMTRTHKRLTPGQRTALIEALVRGTPAAMSDGAWSHIFDSACNTLALTAPDHALLKMLEHVALNDSRLVMRLYALQHLGRHYAAASPASQQRLRSLVQGLLLDPSSKTAGTALVLWRQWESAAEPGQIPAIEMSRAIAADAGRPVDVRVSALHVVGQDPSVLDLARTLAKDRVQPVILRKAALNLIGRHGTLDDLPLLRVCSRESARLAQAGEPAVRVLQDRLAGIAQPVLQPYH
jgi:hypothetical protein